MIDLQSIVFLLRRFFLLGGLFFYIVSPANAENSAARLSIVGIKAQIPDSGKTVPFLGTERNGTGIVIDSEGLVVTIGYLILEAETVQIIDNDGQEIPATVVGYHVETGFGLVRSLLDLKAPPIALGDPAKLEEKELVQALSFQPKLEIQEVIVAGRSNFVGYWEYLLENAIYTVPAISAYAGAALIDEKGALLGVGSLFLRDIVEINNQSVSGNLFVPVDRLMSIIPDLEKYGRPSGLQRPWLGLILTEQFGRVLVSRSIPSGPAQLAGLEPGDIILEIAGTPIDSRETLYRTLWNLGDSGIVVPMTLLHQNTINKIKINSGNFYNHYQYSHIF